MVNHKRRKRLLFVAVPILILAFVYLWAILRTRGRTVIQFDIKQNKELIHLSAFAEPPQFAIWIEDPETGKMQTVFVTHRAGVGDWEGKADVPVALPRWSELTKGGQQKNSENMEDPAEFMAVTGATPKEDYFSMRVEVPPNTKWICWIEMNLSGDYNDAFPEFDVDRKYEDVFGCGQPALLYRAEIVGLEGQEVRPDLYAQSIWEGEANRIEPVSDGVTTARSIFEEIYLRVSKPKPKLLSE